ncbi:T9SS type A sorting domain-containing protein [candidate division WOR-3 bacterium]|nr:T9SS type A sorting domain-containing protein [candidate division WOR-3 bacterium]
MLQLTISPNPFRGSTVISYQLPSACHVSLIIFDVTGREVISIKDQLQSPGDHQLIWNGTDSRLLPLRAGTYFYRFQMDENQTTGVIDLI